VGEGSGLDGVPIEATIDPVRGVAVLWIRRADGELLVGPASSTRLWAGDTLILMGDADAIDALPTEPPGSS
jgi:K+/H+ antiporter YhaU regulatory subunit KhtT